MPADPLGLSKLEALAQQATPGPWVADGAEKVEGARSGFMHDICYPAPCVFFGDGHPTARTNATYIAAVSPEVVKRLIAALRRAERLRAALRECVAAQSYEEAQMAQVSASAALAEKEEK